MTQRCDGKISFFANLLDYATIEKQLGNLGTMTPSTFQLFNFSTRFGVKRAKA